MTWPRLFILGAGFARPAGLPLVADLLDLVLAELAALNGGETHLHWSLADYLDYKLATTGSRPSPVDIEDFAAFLDRQLFFGNLASDTWSADGNRDQFLLRWGIGRVLHRVTPPTERLPSFYFEFAERLRPLDVVASFNYDLVLEQALDMVGHAYRRFPQRLSSVDAIGGTVDTEREDDEIVIAKLHGSVDWVSRRAFDRRIESAASAEIADFMRRRDALFGPSVGTATRPLVDGPRLTADPLREIMVVEDLDSYFADHRIAYEHPPLLLPPSEDKQLYGQTLRELWQGLAQAGQFRSGFSVIGYSLPPADGYARQVLYDISRGYVRWRTVRNVDEPIQTITVVDLRDQTNLSDLVDAYRFLPAEHTTWLTSGFGRGSIAQLFAGSA